MGHLHPKDLTLQVVLKLLLWWKQNKTKQKPSGTPQCPHNGLRVCQFGLCLSLPSGSGLRSGRSWPQLLILTTHGSPGGSWQLCLLSWYIDVQRTSKNHKHSSFHSNRLQPGVESADVSGAQAPSPFPLPLQERGTWKPASLVLAAPGHTARPLPQQFPNLTQVLSTLGSLAIPMFHLRYYLPNISL